MKKIFLLFLLLFAPLSSAFSDEALPTKQETAMPPNVPPEWIQQAENENSLGPFFSQMLHMLLALGGIIALMLIAAWVMKRLLHSRMKQMNISSLIKIVERRALNPKSAVYLLDICGKGVVIAESPMGIKRIAEVDLPPEEAVEAEKSPESSSFSKIMQEKMRKE